MTSRLRKKLKLRVERVIFLGSKSRMQGRGNDGRNAAATIDIILPMQEEMAILIQMDDIKPFQKIQKDAL
jgi:hypothetical protein